jgi:uncharacterized protein YndB with AHSA1/START domain
MRISRGGTGGLGLALLLVATTATAEVKDATPAGFTIENARTVPVAPDAAWRALVADVDRWWPKDHSWWGRQSTLSIEPRAGGCFCEKGQDGREAAHLQVVFVDPGKTLRMTGGLGPLQGMGLHGVLEWRLQPEGQGTRIALHYRAGGYAPDDLGKFAPVVDRVMAQQLGGLADYLSAP